MSDLVIVTADKAIRIKEKYHVLPLILDNETADMPGFLRLHAQDPLFDGVVFRPHVRIDDHPFVHVAENLDVWIAFWTENFAASTKYGNAIKRFVNRKEKRWLCGSKILDLDSPKLMGIWNVSHDSFSQHLDKTRGDIENFDAVLISEGADILDIGAESTRPGAEVLASNIERIRLEPFLRKKYNEIVSVDTYHVDTMAWLVKEQLCDVLNDIGKIEDCFDGSEDRRTDALYALLRESNMGYVLMAPGDPSNISEQAPELLYRQSLSYFHKHLTAMAENGICLDRIVIDPGIGFGKSFANDFLLLRSSHFFAMLGRPVLIAYSRKRFLRHITGNALENIRAANCVAGVLALQNGADILRVHDVCDAKDAIRLLRM